MTRISQSYIYERVYLNATNSKKFHQIVKFPWKDVQMLLGFSKNKWMISYSNENVKDEIVHSLHLMYYIFMSIDMYIGIYLSL